MSQTHAGGSVNRPSTKSLPIPRPIRLHQLGKVLYILARLLGEGVERFLAGEQIYPVGKRDPVPPLARRREGLWYPKLFGLFS